jgi:predicted acyl esterase
MNDNSQLYVVHVCLVSQSPSGWSFGVWPWQLSRRYDIVEALVKLDWCNDAVGIVGNSYLAITQYYCAVNPATFLEGYCTMGSLFRSLPRAVCSR